MATGISEYLANALLDHVSGNATYTPPAAIYAQAHDGDPGADMTTSVVAGIDRVEVDYNTAANFAITLSNTPEVTLAADNTTVSFVSFWDAATAGNPLWSDEANAAKTGDTGDIIRIDTARVSLGPKAS